MTITNERGNAGVDLGDMTLTAATDDNATTVLTSDEVAGFSVITIEAPDVAQVAAFTVYSYRSGDETADGAWNQVESPPGTALVIARAKSIVLKEFPWRAIRLQSAGTEIADHAFLVRGARGLR